MVGLKGKEVFEKLFARDFCMIALEIASKSESRNDKPWMEEKNPHSPYILIERADGTCYVWYNKEGVSWTNRVLAQRVKSDKAFLKKVETKVREGIKFIRPIYEEQRILDRKDLLIFIDEFLEAYPWIEAMWWIKSMNVKELGVDNSNIVKLRDETEILSDGTEIVIRKSLEKLYPKLRILSSMIRLKELKSDKIPSKEVLGERMKGFVISDSDLILDNLNNFAKQNSYGLQRIEVDSSVSEIKGEVGFRGKVKGVVCKVMGHSDFGKIKDGQILVSPMTMVDFFPEMKKAIAFITDEGGITCHASIVARELRKPCIIGTRVATQILKNGDLVEVDVNEGIVRIIERKEVKRSLY